MRDQAENTGYDKHFEDEAAVKRARAGYLGLVSSLDENIGHVLDALEDCGFGGNTSVLYTSDHGDNLGARGLWGKQVLYEEAAKVPMILAGPDVPAGVVRSQPVSHVDVYPTRDASAWAPIRRRCTTASRASRSSGSPRARTRRAPCSPSITRPRPAPASS